MAEPTPSPVAATGEAARSAGRGAAGFLRARTFGMPRYVFLALLAGGIAFGLYWRQRRATEAIDQTAPDSTAVPVPGDSLAANTDEPGLAGVGVAGVAPGQVVPVSTPTLPEGLTDVYGALTGGLVDLASEFPSAAEPPSVTVQPRIIVQKGKGGGKKGGGKKRPAKKQGAGHKKKAHASSAHSVTGGGPPVRRAASHKPPRKKRR